MNRDYNGHIDDRKKEDFSVHQDACERVEKLLREQGKQYVPSSDETIKKECYHYELSDGSKIQVIGANTIANESSQPSITIEHKGVSVRSNRGGSFFMKGRIRSSMADIIYFVIYHEDKKIEIIPVSPIDLVAYMDALQETMDAVGIHTIPATRNAKMHAIKDWNFAFKRDSEGKVRILAPISVYELRDISKKIPSQIGMSKILTETHNFTTASDEDKEFKPKARRTTDGKFAPKVVPTPPKPLPECVIPITPIKFEITKTDSVTVNQRFNVKIDGHEFTMNMGDVTEEKARKIVEILLSK